MPEEVASIAFIMFNYAPAWEAASKQITLLHQAMVGERRSVMLGFNTRGTLLRARGSVRIFPAPLLLAPKSLLRAFLHRYDVHHLFASYGERHVLPLIAGKQAILTIAKGGGSPERAEPNVAFLKRFRYVITEAEQDRELLLQCGLAPDAVKLIRPGAHVKPYQPASGPFTILFATSPLTPNELLSRGVFLMARTAKMLPDVRFVLAWRKQQYAEVRRLLRDVGAPNIEVRNGLLDMDELYGSAHATILPGLHPSSMKPCPQSLSDSLGHGKPVLVSRALSISSVIAQTGAGVVFEPTLDGLVAAIGELRESYDDYQKRCHPATRSHFSPQEFVERHRRLYHALD